MPTSNRTKRRSAPPRAARPPLRPSVLADTAEDVGEAFAEATEHVVQQRLFSDLVPGPVVQIPMTDLTPGAFGWKRSISRRPTRKALPNGTEGASMAEVACVIVPAARRRVEADDPFRVARRDPERVIRPCPGWPPRVILGVPGTGVGESALIGFLDAVIRELTEDETAESPR